jgi:hypothetical protein
MGSTRPFPGAMVSDVPETLSLARVRRLLAKGPDDLVRVYTFQAAGAVEAASRRGYWTGDPGFAQEGYPEAYAWMVRQMAARIPGFSGDYPMWAYLRRPNMRHHEYDATPSFLVVADVPRSRMLLSDYDRWHEPLNVSYLTDTEAEMVALEDAGLQTYAATRVATPEMQATWEGVFDLSTEGWSPEKLAYWKRPNRIQASIDRIHPHEVVRISRVHGRRWRNSARYREMMRSLQASDDGGA